jgi:hypothetical protein
MSRSKGDGVTPSASVNDLTPQNGRTDMAALNLWKRLPKISPPIWRQCGTTSRLAMPTQEARARVQEARARAQEARTRARAATCQALARQAPRGPFNPREGLVIQVRGKGLVIQVKAELTTIQCPALVKEGVDNNGPASRTASGDCKTEANRSPRPRTSCWWPYRTVLSIDDQRAERAVRPGCSNRSGQPPNPGPPPRRWL